MPEMGLLMLHNDEAKAKYKKTIVDHLFPNIKLDKDFNLVEGTKAVEEAMKDGRKLEKTLWKYTC
jgi:uncharacterized membrane protein